MAGALRFSDNDCRADRSFRGAARALYEVQSRIVRDSGSVRNMMTADVGKMVFYSKNKGARPARRKERETWALRIQSQADRSEQHAHLSWQSSLKLSAIIISKFELPFWSPFPRCLKASHMICRCTVPHPVNL